MDFKDTLNLPDPDFTIPMKADLAQREPAMQANWDEIGIYEMIQKERKDAPLFLLHDGPPYTNSPIHIGTALNKTLKDFVLKSHLVMGYRVPYVPGYDNHGLPIEQAVMRGFLEHRIVPTRTELRKACRDHARKYIDLQTKQFKRLGIFGMWDKPYTTMDYRFEAGIIRVFKLLVERGFVYRGLRPTLWSPTAQTALADTEIVYKEVTSKAIYVRFPLVQKEGLPSVLQGLSNVFAVIWTTTPWTIPANLGLAFHPDFQYDVVNVNGDHYIVVHQLVDKLKSALDWVDAKTIGSFKGSEIERVKFKHPIFDRESLAVLADYVTVEDGTGVVHTAPGHGRDDFYTGQKYGLPILCPVNERGILTAEAGEFEGVHYKQCDTVVVERLRELGNLVAVQNYTHSYPHAERDDQPVIFRATEQWFVSVEHNHLREKLLDAIDHKVEWFPRSGHGRMRSMMATRPDWCVSRQRPWGVGIPVFYGKKSGEPVLDPVAIDSVAALVESEGSDAWYEREPSEILPPGYKHPETGESEFRKETDVFDVWFDSGSTSICVFDGNIEPAWKEPVPADVYLEGSDQHRGWFNLSLIISMAIRGEAPYRAVVTHGFVNDEQGDKMSKRSGNAIDPEAVCAQHGADILRYWSASVDYENDAPISEALLKTAGDGYRRVRNTLRFLLGNLFDFEPEVQATLGGIDLWMLEKAECLVQDCLEDYKHYRFNAALGRVHNFCVNEVSAFYGSAIKDRMYCDGADWSTRRSAQWVCYEVLRKLTLLLMPIIPHTAEEIYAKIPGRTKQSVFLDHLEPVACIHDTGLHQLVDVLLDIRGWVFAEFETWKATSEIRDPQDICATVTLPEAEAHVLQHFSDELAILFNMASIDVKEGDRSVSFAAAPWPKCERSRLRRPDVENVVYRGETVALSARDRKVLGL